MWNSALQLKLNNWFSEILLKTNIPQSVTIHQVSLLNLMIIQEGWHIEHINTRAVTWAQEEICNIATLWRFIWSSVMHRVQLESLTIVILLAVLLMHNPHCLRVRSTWNKFCIMFSDTLHMLSTRNWPTISHACYGSQNWSRTLSTVYYFLPNNPPVQMSSLA